ncbi:hypothetical protein GCM10027030_01030 [Luteococcus sediminum]
MKRVLTSAIGMTVMAAAVAMGASPAHAAGVSLVSCSSPTKQVSFYSASAGRYYCYSGRGSISVKISNVTRVTSAVSGHFWGNKGGSSVRTAFGPGSNFSPVYGNVTSITIY